MGKREAGCKICPRECGIDRNRVKGFCGVGTLPVVAKAFLHMWEEPCISGVNGSGTVLFSGCNLKCVYCQNYTISQEHFGKETTIDGLRRIFLNLQNKGAHNINLVSPSHYVLQIREALEGLPELNIPVIYNSNGYESREGLMVMEGLVDVYLPDLKYCSSEAASKYSRAADYFEVAARALMEMYRQVGSTVFDKNGMIKKGMIIRHLILPGQSSESIKILDWIRGNLPDDITVSLMSQYTPYYKSEGYPEINRRITRWEYERVLNHFIKLGFENGYVQERDSAEEKYIPDFNLEGVDN